MNATSAQTVTTMQPTEGSRFRLYINIARSLFFICGLVQVIFNPIAIAAILKAKLYKRNLTSILIIFQFFGDTLCGAITLFSISYNIFAKKKDLQFECVSIALADALYFFFVASLSNTFLVSLERFLIIRKPLRYKEIMNTFRVTSCAACVWVLCLLFVICPTVYEASTQEIRFEHGFFLELHKVFPESYRSYIMVPVIIGCMIGTCVSYTGLVLIYYNRHAQRTIAPVSPSTNAAQFQKKKKHRITMTACLVSMVTMVCWSPLAFFLAQPPDRETRFPFYLACLLLQLPPFVNCILYFASNGDFKSALINLIVRMNRVAPVA